MKKLTNKKGFTLIEMLVVIAIIAVLVAIIIPVVSSATDKAAAATNAANLRSIKAEATTDLLNGATNDEGYVKFTPKNGSTPASFTPRTGAPAAKKCGDCVKDATLAIFLDASGNVQATYGGFSIDQFAYIAENGGDLSTSTPGAVTKPGT